MDYNEPKQEELDWLDAELADTIDEDFELSCPMQCFE